MSSESQDRSAGSLSNARSRVTLAEVAARAGVSVSVASRVINEDPNLRVREETRVRVLKVVAESSYRPNAAGRSLRTKAAGAIGVFVPDVNNPFFSELIRGVEAGCDKAGLMPLIGRSERLDGTRGLLERMAREGRIDGAIVQLADGLASPAIEKVVSRYVPTVFLTSHTAGSASSVIMDDAAGIAVAVDYLVSLGHTAIGFVGGLPAHDVAMRRERGFRETMSAAGLRPREYWITTAGFSTNNGNQAFESIADTGALPTGLVVSNVNAALGVLLTARHRGVLIPDELSVVALHDSQAAEHSWPALTTVRMPLFELALEAVDSIAQLLDGAEPRATKVSDPPPKLVIRESARRISDPTDQAGPSTEENQA